MRPVRVVRPSPPEILESPDFDAVFQGEFDYVWFTLRRLGVDARDLEDVTHEVFILVYQQFDRYEPDRPLRPWLFAFAYRVAAGYKRLARHRVDVRGDLSEVSDPAPSTVDQLATRQSLELAWRAIGALDLDRRSVFVLHEVEGYAMPEVARALQIPLNTAYSRLRLARGDFAKAVQRLARGSHER
jgi:RNA polymerase sigma-70 factor (ECF subfamily)